MTFLVFPNIVPPSDQTKFESVWGYEWAYRLTAFAKTLTDEVNSGGPGGGGPISITGTFPIIATPNPITGIGVLSHGASGVVPGTYGDATHFLVATVEVDGHTTNAQAFPISTVSASNLTVLYGDARDGNVTLDGVAVPSWASIVSPNVYRMNDACMCSNLTINNGITLRPQGFSIFVLNTLTDNGTIDGQSNDASGSTAGGTLNYNPSWTSTVPGGAGSNGTINNSANAGTQTNCLGGAGGKGGAGSVGTAGNGGIASRPSIANGGEKFAATFSSANAAAFGSPVTYTSAAGGSGGGGDGASIAGGGGGSGAGIFYVNARLITGIGTMKCIGGAGAAGTGTNAGGGGGGGGGIIVVVTSTVNWQSVLTVSVAGGPGGASGGGAGNPGANGAAGRIISLTTG